MLIGTAPVRLKVDARARRVSLRVDAARAEVVATAPDAGRLEEALRFAESRGPWIAERLKALPQPQPLQPGLVLHVDGAPCRLERAAMRIRARLQPPQGEDEARLIASGDGEAYARAVVRVLERVALQRLTERTLDHVTRLSLPHPEVAVMDAKMRWGSCRKGRAGAPGRIRYSWRLILAPPWVLDYVAAHEVAHLLQSNHSAAYWAIVHRIFGDHRAARAWLRGHGASLFAFGAGA